jgi:hypothetical protein
MMEHACLHPECHGDPEDGEEHGYWNQATRCGAISLIGDCEHYQQEYKCAEELGPI